MKLLCFYGVFFWQGGMYMDYSSKPLKLEVSPGHRSSDMSSSSNHEWLRHAVDHREQLQELATMDDEAFRRYLQERESLGLGEQLTQLRESLRRARSTDRPLSQSSEFTVVRSPQRTFSDGTFSGDTISTVPAVSSDRDRQPVTREEIAEKAQMFAERINDMFSNGEINRILEKNPEAQKNVKKINDVIEGDPELFKSIMSLSGEYGILDHDKFEMSITGEILKKSKTDEVKTDERISGQTNEIEENNQDRELSRLRKQLRGSSSFEEEIKAITQNEEAFKALVRQTIKVLEKALKISENEVEYFTSTVESIYRDPYRYRDTAVNLYQYYKAYKANIRSRGKMCKSMQKAGRRVWRFLDTSKPTILQLKMSVAIHLHEQGRRHAHLEGKHGWEKLTAKTALGRQADELMASVQADRTSKKDSIAAARRALKNILLHEAIVDYVDQRRKNYHNLSISDAEKNILLTQTNFAYDQFANGRLLLGQKDIISEINGSEARISDYMKKMNDVVLSRIERAGNTPFLTALNDFASDMGFPLGAAGLVLSALGAAGVFS
jgi:hypothetical protein